MTLFAESGIFLNSRKSIFATEGTRLLLNKSTIQTLWPCAPLNGEVECAPAVLHAICVEAVGGVQKLARGGLELGGVLFGVVKHGLTRILAARPIQCEHRFGPSFVLSDNDQALLKQMLLDFRSD